MPKSTKKSQRQDLTWDLTKLFDGDDDVRMAADLLLVKEKSYAFIDKWKDREDYLQDPAVLTNALGEYESWARECAGDGDNGYYWWLRSSQDQDNPKCHPGNFSSSAPVHFVKDLFIAKCTDCLRNNP